MPTCLKCNTVFPVRITVDNRVRNLCNRKYCLVCSPFQQHNTKILHGDQAHAEQKYNICIWCNKPYKRGHHKRALNCGSCQVKQTRQKHKKMAVDILGGKCSICGYDRCIQALAFHHINPENKSFEIGSNSFCWSKIKAELDKCVLLCSRCHIEVHNGFTKLP